MTQGKCGRKDCRKRSTEVRYSGPLREYGMRPGYCTADCLLQDLADAKERQADHQDRVAQAHIELERDLRKP